MLKPKKVSLSFEVYELEAAVEAARLLVDTIRDDAMLQDVDARRTVDAIAGTLSLVSTRIRDLGRAMRGSVAVEKFWTRYNECIDDTEQDVVLRELSAPAPARAKKSDERR